MEGLPQRAYAAFQDEDVSFDVTTHKPGGGEYR